MINKENKQAARQIVHEAEITRQHTRYKIPAKIEIEGKLYTLQDWSLSGCAIENLPQEYCQNKKSYQAKIIFNFDDFVTMVEHINIDFICKRNSSNVGGRFHNLNPAQLAILNQIITAYVSGDIITQGDIIHAVTKQITYPKKIEKKVNKKKADFLLIVIYLVIIALVSFLSFVAYQRTFVVQTLNAYIDANLISLKTPHPSYITFPKPLHEGKKVKVGDTIAIAHFIGGGTQRIISSVDGKIYSINALNNEFKNTAEPICTILEKNSKSYIVTHLNHKNIQKISLGNIAKVRLADNTIIKAKVTKILPAQSVIIKHTKTIANIYTQARDYDTVILQPLEKIDTQYINSSVFVTIDTFLQ